MKEIIRYICPHCGMANKIMERRNVDVLATVISFDVTEQGRFKGFADPNFDDDNLDIEWDRSELLDYECGFCHEIIFEGEPQDFYDYLSQMGKLKKDV